jgi:hypothetical protein
VRSPDERLAVAKALISLYKLYVKRSFTYAMEPASGRFITPHEYVAAQRFVKSYHDER